MEIAKKIWPDFFEKVLSGEKTFEYRLADWECNSGDTLILREWDPEKKDYTGREVAKKVGYVLSLKDVPEFHTKEEIEEHGFKIISLLDE